MICDGTANVYIERKVRRPTTTAPPTMTTTLPTVRLTTGPTEISMSFYIVLSTL